MKYQVILRAGKDGWIVAECPDLPGCFTQGKTRDEALANITEAIQLSLETRRELSMAVPDESEIQPVELIKLEVT